MKRLSRRRSDMTTATPTIQCPSITIITVCRNALEELQRTRDSVKSQFYPSLEHVIVDGASSDGTRGYLEAQSGIVWVSEPDRGIYDAMNKGIDMATGDYILMLNAGDSLHNSTSLRTLVTEAANSGSLPSVITGRILFWFPGVSSKWIWPVEGSDRSLVIAHQATLVAAKLYSKSRYDPSYRISGDREFFLRNSTHVARGFHGMTIVSDNVLGGVSNSGAAEWRKFREDRLIDRTFGKDTLKQTTSRVLKTWFKMGASRLLTTSQYVRFLMHLLFGPRRPKPRTNPT